MFRQTLFPLRFEKARRSQKTPRIRIEKLAEEMGYKKNPTVAHLMAELCRSRTSSFQATLAIVNANVDPAAFIRHPTIPAYVEGCRRRASQLGYNLDEFWLHDKELDGERLNRILRARNIRGIIVVGLMKENRLPERFLSTWQKFHAVVTGVRTSEPTLSFTCTDHHIVALKAFEQALRLGYRRPAIVLDDVIDRLVDGRFTSGFYIAQQQLPKSQRIQPFYDVAEARERPEIFQRWFEKEKPDLILTLYNVVQHWLEKMEIAIPGDVGLIQLEWRKDRPHWAGMNQHNDQVGEAAVEMVINMIHNHPSGPPEFPLATLIGSTWVEGKTIRTVTAVAHKETRKASA